MAAALPTNYKKLYSMTLKQWSLTTNSFSLMLVFYSLLLFLRCLSTLIIYTCNVIIMLLMWISAILHWLWCHMSYKYYHKHSILMCFKANILKRWYTSDILAFVCSFLITPPSPPLPSPSTPSNFRMNNFTRAESHGLSLESSTMRAIRCDAIWQYQN